MTGERIAFAVQSKIVVQKTIGEHPLGYIHEAVTEPSGLPLHVRTYRIPEQKLDSGAESAIHARLSQPLLVHDVPTVAEVHAWGEEKDSKQRFVAWHLPPGRMLFSRATGASPLDIDATLDVILDLVDALLSLREQGVEAGPLTPDRVWLCEGGGAIFLALDDALRRHEIAQIPLLRADQVWHIPPEAEQRSREYLGESVQASESRMRVTHALRRIRTEFDDFARAESTYVYQLAVITFFCLSGSHPFFMLDDPAEGIARALEMVAIPLERYADHPVAAVLSRGLQSEPARRFASIEDFARALEMAIRGEVRADATRDEPGAEPPAPRAPATERRRTTEPLLTRTARVHRPEEPSVSSVRAHTVGLWRLVSLLLFASLVIPWVWRTETPGTVVITSTPPGLTLEEVIGHAGVPLGATPIFLRERDQARPLVVRVVAPDGRTGPPLTLTPGSFNDLGTCFAVDLELLLQDGDIAHERSELRVPASP